MNENVKALQPEARGQIFAFGLNPYGLTYHLGLQGAGGPRANPKGAGLEGFIAIATELGAKVLEIYDPWLRAMSDDELRALRDRLAGLGMTPIVSSGLDDGSVRERAAFGPPSRRQGHPPWPDDGFVRRSSRAWRQVERARRRGSRRARRPRSARGRRRQNSGDRESPGLRQRRARRILRDDSRPRHLPRHRQHVSRSPRRRSISLPMSLRTCGTCI